METKPSRMKKHLVLDQSISRLEELENFAGDMLNIMSGNKDPKPCKEVSPDKTEPYLKEVLDNSHNRIKKHRDSIIRILDTIREIIFGQRAIEEENEIKDTSSDHCYHHIRIKGAINNLYDVKIYAEKLLNDIRGEVNSDKNEEIRTCDESLEYILTEGHQKIDKIYEETRKILEEIKEVLF